MLVRIDGGAGYGCFGEGFAMKTEGLRQCYRSDGSAERIIERTLSELNKYSLSLSVIARSWVGENRFDGEFIECDPRFKRRVERERSFAEQVSNVFLFGLL